MTDAYAATHSQDPEGSANHEAGAYSWRSDGA